MKWLLVTTATRTPDSLDSNVGDEFARIGIQRIISEVDKNAVFDVLNKEDPNQWEPRPFDKAVVCGMPLFWSLPSFGYPGSQNCQEAWWWPRLMRGWPSACREHFLIWGVGHVHVGRIRSLLDYVSGIEEAINRSWALVVREPILDHPKIIESVCPSAFVLQGRERKPEVPLCNLMRSGGHFGYLTPDGDLWAERVREVSDFLRENGFMFIAHTSDEASFAESLGWPKAKVKLPVTAGGYFDWFTRASCYFGNRVHGAAVCASAGVPVWAATHDSRIGMVRRLGGKATWIPEVTLENLRSWMVSKPIYPTALSVPEEYARMKELVARFAAQAAKPPWTE